MSIYSFIYDLQIISILIYVESLTEAKKKAKKAVTVSDLSSDEPILSKRKHKIKKIFSPASSTTSSCPLFGKIFNKYHIFKYTFLPNN